MGAGFSLFFGAWLIRMRYIFQFDEKYTSATIKAPVCCGCVDFISVSDGAGAKFEMNKVTRTKWVRISTKADGTKAFEDYHPLMIVDRNGELKEGMQLALESIKPTDAHPNSYYREGGEEGGATA